MVVWLSVYGMLAIFFDWVRMIPLLVVWEPSKEFKMRGIIFSVSTKQHLVVSEEDLESLLELLETNRDRRGDGDNGGFAAHDTELHKHCEDMHFLSCTELCKKNSACLIILSSSLPTEYGSLSSTAMIEKNSPSYLAGMFFAQSCNFLDS